MVLTNNTKPDQVLAFNNHEQKIWENLSEKACDAARAAIGVFKNMMISVRIILFVKAQKTPHKTLITSHF